MNGDDMLRVHDQMERMNQVLERIELLLRQQPVVSVRDLSQYKQKARVRAVSGLHKGKLGAITWVDGKYVDVLFDDSSRATNMFASELEVVACCAYHVAGGDAQIPCTNTAFSVVQKQGHQCVNGHPCCATHEPDGLHVVACDGGHVCATCHEPLNVAVAAGTVLPMWGGA